MAINSNSVLGDKNPVKSISSSKTSNLSSCRLIKINFAGKDSCSSSRANGPNARKDLKSPYFTNDKVQVLSRVTTKKVTDKKSNEFVSSFPLAASVYKANSDEFKLKKRGKHKVKKSVLTLPNEPAPMPKTYTVSDLNDSEYFNGVNDSRVNKSKKRRSVRHGKKSRVKEPTMEIFDRDARYCSQLNIDLDCSSSEIVNFTGDGEKISKMSYESNNALKAGNYPHDVWAILRNINKLQFRPSPPSSQQSVVPLRKRRPLIRKSNNNNDAHFIETCRTEELTYISSFEVDSKTRDSCSPSSSFDRVTVIDKQSEQDEIIQQFSRNIFGSNINFGGKIKSNINNQVRERNKRRIKNINKKESQGKKKVENIQALENNAHNKSPQSEREKSAAVNNNPLLSELASKTSSIFKPTENCSDKSSIKENDSASNPTSDFQKVVRSGDVCRGNNKRSATTSPINKVKVIKPTGDLEKQLNGITKVILSSGKETIPSKVSETQRKPRLALTLPNTNIHKLSRFEIKRRLANQKFPIVILGKDQITNRGIYVPNVDPPQFDGLDKHVWPFMLEWSGEKRNGSFQDIRQKETIKTKNTKLKNKVNCHGDMTTNGNELSNHAVSKKVDHKKKKINAISTINNKMQLATDVSPQVVQKSKPLIHFKNKMFNFLHKNPTPPKPFGNDWNSDPRVEIVQKDKQVGTNDTSNNYLHNKYSLIGVHKEVPEKPVENRIVPKLYSPVRHPWAKGKWASDFIENIIKKIRTGVYYGVDRKENKLKTDSTEVSTQTELNASKNAYCQKGTDLDFESNLTVLKDDPLKNIPGFDKSLSTIEIETISTNKIAVKHCVTNVVVHFDIQVLGEVKNVTQAKKSMSCIPLDVNSNQEKVFKCNTSIINAILPAELCSIIPTMMQNILESENKLLLKPTTIGNVQSVLTRVSEFIEPESPKQMLNALLPGWVISEKIRPFLNGRFQNVKADSKNICKDFNCPPERINSAVVLSPRMNTQILHQYNPLPLNLHIVEKTSRTLIEKPKEETNISYNYCTVLQPYDPKQWSVVPVSGFFNVNDFMTQIIGRLNIPKLNNMKILLLSSALMSRNININISRQLSIQQDQNQYVSLPRSGNEIGVISLFNAKNIPHNTAQSEHSLNTVQPKNDQKKDKHRLPFNENNKVPQRKGQPIKVLKKKSYVKFYRKCKSMSSISNYKSTPLSRVTKLDEFCQILGSNLFSNVLDGCLEKKLMNAIEEMKNWITDISPKQALLILLLTNKKDTPNLIRFRPVLLQGIAVNRITKAEELDTEIEVIERENFKLSQYEGISYLSASPKNQDSLLEELYWIAKTTASDYQKTFDESSEKLLKSLLEKRKKLNPSYLRVMARYVGLGLLAPAKL